MAVARVLRLGHPVLRRVSEPVPRSEITAPATRRLIRDMRETLRSQGGIGLAAPQIGINKQILVLEVPEMARIQPIPFTAVFNPRLEFLLKHETITMWESCLSIPGLVGKVERYNNVDEEGQPKRLACTGYLAGVIQHETDHLIGKLFIDRMKDFTHLGFEEEWEDWLAKDITACDTGTVRFIDGH